MRDENVPDKETNDTQKILELERRKYYLERKNADLQTKLQERSPGQRFGPFLFLAAWFLILKFMENWMPFYISISTEDYIPILLVIIVLIVLEYLRDRKRQAVMEEMRSNRREADGLQREIDEIKKHM